MPVLSQYSDPTGAVSAYASRFLPAVTKPSDKLAVSVSGAQEVSNRVYEINTPFRNFAISKSLYGPTTTGSASTRDIGTLSIVIDEMEDSLTFKYILEWFGLVENSDMTRNPPAYYKRRIRMFRMSSVHSDIMVSDYMGCFPTEINPISNSTEGNSITQYAVTFSVDYDSHNFMTDTALANEERRLVKAVYNG